MRPAPTPLPNGQNRANFAAPAGKTNGHHSDPKFMGGNPKQPLTDVLIPDHKGLHRDLNDFLAGKTDAAGNHMRPQRGNSGRTLWPTLPVKSVFRRWPNSTRNTNKRSRCCE